jgi:hypothetical protein
MGSAYGKRMSARTRRDTCLVQVSHDSDSKDCYPLGCDTVQFGTGLPTYRKKQRNILTWIIVLAMNKAEVGAS